MSCHPYRLWPVIGVLCAVTACKADPQQTARKHLARGDKYVTENKLAEAAVEYRGAVANTPNDGEAHYKLANVHARRADYREAFGEYQRAADLLPDRDDVQ